MANKIRVYTDSKPLEYIASMTVTKVEGNSITLKGLTHTILLSEVDIISEFEIGMKVKVKYSIKTR